MRDIISYGVRFREARSRRTQSAVNPVECIISTACSPSAAMIIRLFGERVAMRLGAGRAGAECVRTASDDIRGGQQAPLP